MSNNKPLFKDKIEEFIKQNPNIVEESKVKIDEYGTVIKKDEMGRDTYRRYEDGSEEIWNYGKFGIEYHKNTKTGLEEYHTYDEFGNEIKYENNSGDIEEKQYDKKNRVIAEWDNKGNKNIYEYDEEDRIIYEEINNKIAKKTIYQKGAFENFTYTYNSETDMVSIEYKNYVTGYKDYRILENGTEQWLENFKVIKEIPKAIPIEKKKEL